MPAWLDQEEERERLTREALADVDAGHVTGHQAMQSRVLKGSSPVTPEMALRLSKAIGRSPISWLAMQDAHDLWVARQHVDSQRVGRLRLATV